MKYLFNVVQTPISENENIILTSDDIVFTSFPAVVGNPNYDQFLEQTGLTDTEVHELEPDVWYDFPQKEEQ